MDAISNRLLLILKTFYSCYNTESIANMNSVNDPNKSVSLFVLRLNVPVNNFSVISGRNESVRGCGVFRTLSKLPPTQI